MERQVNVVRPWPGRLRSTWWAFIVACVVVRLAIPLLALTFEGSSLPDLPAYDYGPLYGDANGFYATARELISGALRGAPLLLAVLVLGAGAIVLSVRRCGRRSWVTLLAAACVASAATVVLVLNMNPAGIPAIGWPLLWAIPLAPIRVIKPGLGPGIAFACGFALSLAAVGFTVVATAFAGYWASGRRSVGLLAAALFTLWPFVPGLVVGPRAWENGTWNVDVGLHLYAEPLSTALIVGAIALLLRERATDLAIVAAGLALGFGTIVKLTNAVIAAAVVVIVACARGLRPAALLFVASLVFAPVLIVYWAQGYASTYDGAISVSNNVWAVGHVRESWGDSLLFTPWMLVLLVPAALAGAALLPSQVARVLLVVPTALTAAVYSVYLYTPIHPRFLYVVLPLVLVLDAVAVVRGIEWGQALLANRSRSVSERSHAR